MLKSALDIVRPTDDIIRAVAENMRQCDRAEIWLSHRHVPIDGLKRSIAISRNDCYAAVADGVPLAVFGVAAPSLTSLTGSPWMLGSDSFNLYRKEIAAASRPMINYLRGGYTLLENWVHSDNMTSVRWLRSCGFTVEAAEPYGPFGAYFHHFWMTGELKPCAIHRQ